jgi:pantetheine-phosphate adenylyltransferase
MSKKSYPVVALGGTFDHFHLGHIQFLNFAWHLGEKLCLGITHPDLTKNKPFAETIQAYETREKNVKNYCQTERIDADFYQLTDLYGPTLEPNLELSALVVTDDTIHGAKAINQRRQLIGLKPVPVHLCPLLRDETNQIISSIRIRAGEIDQAGLNFDQILNQDLVLNLSQREFLSQPQGKPVESPTKENKTPLICVVGDSSLEQFIENDWAYDLGIYDYRQQREAVKSKLIKQVKTNYQTENKAGLISQPLTIELKKALHNLLNKDQQSPQHLYVQGEEDLAAVALILLAPLQTRIYYGQPGEALIEMMVNLDLKKKIYQVLTV